MSHFASQGAYDVRFEWGLAGLSAILSAGVRTVVVVDVLSFSTCVAIAVDREAVVLPYAGTDDDASAFAHDHGAILAGHRANPETTYSLSPASVLSVPRGMRLVLPSRNGSSLSCEASSKCIVVAGCLRNRDALASWLRESSEPVGLIAAGERWPDGSLRPCLEDLLGCGAIAAELSGRLSPEARAAVATYDSVKGTIDEVLCECSSGRELIEKGFSIDVRLAAEVDVTDAVPVLKNDAYTSVALLRKL